VEGVEYSDTGRPEVVPFVPDVARLLDVGCHRGAFGETIARRGCEVWGIEPDPAAAAVAESRLARVIVGFFPDDMTPGEPFDCITFNDVLEHMVDPQAALAAAAEHLVPGGYVVASIPNIRQIEVLTALALHGRWDYAGWGILDRTHLRFFTKATMRELFEGAGFRVEQQTPINQGGAVGKWKLLLRAAGHQREEFEAHQYVLVARRSRSNGLPG